MATISRHPYSALEEEDSDSNNEIPALAPLSESKNDLDDNSEAQTLSLGHPPIKPLPFHRCSTIEFVSGLVVNGKLSSDLWDTAACNGNGVDRLGCVRETAKVQVYTSPLFPDRTFTSRHVVYLDIDFPSMGFSILQIMCRIMEDSDIQAQAPIIFGQDLISMCGILNYIIKPDKYCAVQPPA